METLIAKLKADDLTFEHLNELMREVDALPKAQVADVTEAITGVAPAASDSKANMQHRINSRVARSITTRRRMQDTQSVF